MCVRNVDNESVEYIDDQQMIIINPWTNRKIIAFLLPFNQEFRCLDAMIIVKGQQYFRQFGHKIGI